MFSGPLEDRMAIRELHDSYCDAVLRKDPNDWGALWAEDAVWSLMGTEVVGRENIVNLWNGAMSAFDAVSFLGIPGSLEVTGDTASGRYQTHEILVEKGEPRIAGGRYDDEFVKINGQWLYSKRIFNVVAQMGGNKL
ncbi:nuclear transport factor 2 family protein [Parasphingorhabdus halotolerans]|uniref:Nuclear transport factor 2 family protein n=1 Tax=Parasphingorhabdus halotolerans TaxID=2725558 RepID=A0A6H2DN50_9SPHN|nr:nuclear transport factor 2 family protein [Parasphingorhabdus halotolerans]QJB69810.1 nuclear transport factor 2 family protein [Parasphingorhabdus halotolerans]